jgi:Protein of unknown function (DUF3467)
MTEPVLNVDVPADAVAGVHADYASVWTTPETCVIDFLTVTAPIRQQTGEDGVSRPVVNTTLVSRVRIPPTHVWELMKALEKQLSQWEAKHGMRTPRPTKD